MKPKKDLDFRDLLEENFEKEWDEWENEESFEEEHLYDGLDEGFSSWQDYYTYKYG